MVSNYRYFRKIIALFLTLIAASLAVVIVFYWQQIRHLKLFVLLHDLRKKSHAHSNISLSVRFLLKNVIIGTFLKGTDAHHISVAMSFD